MGWTKARSVWTEVVEKDLQAVFDKPWHEAPGRRAGGPQWIFDEVKGIRRREHVASVGYRFEPDVVWDLGERGLAVIELKCAAKFEPLALAEALHHARILGQREKRKVLPITVTSFNPWMRHAVRYLHENGLNSEALLHIEVDHLATVVEGPTTAAQRLLWFDPPLATWTHLSKAPDEAIPVDVSSDAHWYKVDGCQTWVVSPDRDLGDEDRRVIVESPHAMFASVTGSPGAFTAWESAGVDGVERYHVFWPSGGDGPARLTLSF